MSEFVKAICIGLAVIFLILLAVDFLVPTYGFLAKVESGNVGIVTYFGKIEDKVLPAGFHFTGFFEHVHPVNIRTQKVNNELIAFSSDIQQVTLAVAINYNITPEIAHTLYKTVGNDYLRTLMAPRIQENVKVVVSNYTAERLIASRENISGEVLDLLREDLGKYGITVTAVSIENIDFTDAFEAAVEAKQVATQEAQRAKTQQEQATMEAEQDAKRKKIEADAVAEIAKTKADADAYVTRVKAEAEAEANKEISASITRDLIDYVQAQQWNGKLPDIVSDGGVMPIISSQPDWEED